MKLTYWLSACLHDHDFYSIRRRTKKEVIEELKKIGCQKLLDKTWSLGNNSPDYDKVVKVTVDYNDGVDLIFQCLQQGGHEWEL